MPPLRLKQGKTKVMRMNEGPFRCDPSMARRPFHQAMLVEDLSLLKKTRQEFSVGDIAQGQPVRFRLKPLDLGPMVRQGLALAIYHVGHRNKAAEIAPQAPTAFKAFTKLMQPGSSTSFQRRPGPVIPEPNGVLIDRGVLAAGMERCQHDPRGDQVVRRPIAMV